MKVVWSLPVRGESLESSRGDLVRARALVEALRSHGHRVVVVQDGGVPGARMRVAAYRRLVRPLVPGRLGTALRDVIRVLHGRAHGRRVAAAAIRENADVIVETQVHFSGSGAVAARLSGVPLVLDDCSPWTEEGELGAALPGLAARVFRGQVRAASGLTASSAQIRDRLVESGAPPGKVHVVPNGVDTGAFLRADRDEARRRLGFGSEVVVAFVGSFQPWHRAELLVEALRLRPGRGLRLLLIGDGPGREKVLRRAQALGLREKVTAPGALHGADLAASLAAADIGALPSSNDYGQPMKLLDYAAAGLAIVAANLPPVRAMIEPDVTGILVPPDDPAALSAAFGTLAEVPVARVRLGKIARERLAAQATWSARARTLLGTVGREPAAGCSDTHPREREMRRWTNTPTRRPATGRPAPVAPSHASTSGRYDVGGGFR